MVTYNFFTEIRLAKGTKGFYQYNNENIHVSLFLDDFELECVTHAHKIHQTRFLFNLVHFLLLIPGSSHIH